MSNLVTNLYRDILSWYKKLNGLFLANNREHQKQELLIASLRLVKSCGMSYDEAIRLFTQVYNEMGNRSSEEELRALLSATVIMSEAEGLDWSEALITLPGNMVSQANVILKNG